MPILRSLAVLLFLCATAACDSPPTSDTRTPAAIQAVSGAVQEGPAGTQLAEPLVVRVTDAGGRAVAGATVQFVVTAGGGAVAAVQGLTDAAGEARTTWRLGTVAGDTQRVEARLVTSSGTPPPPAAFRAVGRAAAAGAPQAVGTVQRSGPAGAALPEPLAVKVVDAFGNPVAGVAVAWQVVAGGGTVTPAGAVTGADGVAAAQWSLGPMVGAGQQVRATTSQGAVEFGGVATLPADVALQAESGSGQTGAAGTALSAPLVARVLLADGRPLQGAPVHWTPGAGTVSPVDGVTDAAGRASTQWTLPQQAGTAILTASVPATSATASFTATVAAAAPASIQAVGGVQFTGPAGAPLAQHPAVRVLDAYGNAVPGVAVSWEVVSGGGAVVSAAGGGDGSATVQWWLGPVLGAGHQLRATSPVGTVDFTATATLPADVVLQVESGSGQTGAAGIALPAPLVARVLLADGRPLQGATVRWTTGSGTLSPTEWVTDAGGWAPAEWMLPRQAGTAVATVTVPGTGATATFAANVVAGAPASIEAVGPVAFTGPAGEPLAQRPAVRVLDAYGNPVPGVAVSWTVVSGRGALASAASGADGGATVQWWLGPVLGTGQQLRASASIGTVDFTATATLPANVALRAESGSGQTGAAGSTLPAPLVARVVLANGRPLHGATVRFTPGAGTVSPTEGVTDAGGRASTQWTLPQQPGTVSLTASVPGTSAAATFTANVGAGAPASIEAVGPVAFTGPAGESLAQPPAVRVLDAYGNPVPGVAVSWTVVGGGGAVVSAASGADGTATVQWWLGPELGAGHQLRATAAGGTVDFTATATLPADVVLQAESGSGQTGAAGTTLPAPLVARVLLADRRPLQGATVRWTPGAGAVSPTEGVTDAGGRTSAQWTLPQQTGTVSLTASVPGTSAAAGFTANVAAGAPASIQAVGSVQFTGPAGEPLAQRPAVRVLDAFGNPVPGAAVSWTVVSGGGSVVGTATGADGISTAQWSLGPVLGAGHQLRAAAGGGTVDFAATATFPVGVVLQAESGSGQTGGAGTLLPDPLVARVLLADGRPLQGATVRWTAGAGEGLVVPAEGVTGSTGRVGGQWRLPTQPGTPTVDATLVASGATAPFTATVVAGPPVRVDGVPLASYTITAGDPLNLRARVTDAYGNAVSGVTVTWEPEADAAAATPPSSVTDASGVAATLWTPVRRGYNRMNARTAATADTATWRVFVQPGRITQILFSPRSMTLAAPGLDDEFIAYTADQYGNRNTSANGYVLHVSSTNPAVAEVQPQGSDFPDGWRITVTATGLGSAVIHASITELNVSGSAPVQVGPGS